MQLAGRKRTVSTATQQKDLGSAPTGQWVTLDAEGLVTEDMGLCKGVVFVCRDGPPSYYPDVRPFPQIGEVQVLAYPTAHLGADRLLRPPGDRLRVTLHGRDAVSSPTVWSWLAACCPTAELTCVFRLNPGSVTPGEVLHAHLAPCATAHPPFLRTLVLVDPRGHPHILAAGSWRAPWLWQLRHLVIDTWGLGGGAPVLRDLVGLDTLDWRAHAHDVPGWPVTGPTLLSLVSPFRPTP